MIRALVRKELKEHGLLMLGLLVLAVVTLVLVNFRQEDAGRFETLRPFAVYLGLVSVITAGRLVVREYEGRTQLFLEVLPLSRAVVAATKYLLGAGFVLALAAMACAVVVLLQGQSQALTAVDGLMAFSRLGLIGWSAWAFSFLAALLGRYRYMAWIALVVFLYAADELAGVPIQELPIFRLIGGSLGLSTSPIGWDDLRSCVFFILVAGGASAALSLLGEGAAATLLSGRMSARERVFAGCVVMAVLVALDQIQVEREKPPFELRVAEREEVGQTGIRVSVLPSERLKNEDASKLARTIAEDLARLAGALSLTRIPPVSVIPNQGADPEVIERGVLTGKDGIVLRAGVAGAGLDVHSLRAQVVHDVLLDHTFGRAQRFERHWFLDGMSYWLIAQSSPEYEATLWLRAAAVRLPVRADHLRRWDQTSEWLGQCGATAYAFAAVDMLIRTRGLEATLETARQVFAARPQGLTSLLFEEDFESWFSDLDGIARRAEDERLARARQLDAPWFARAEPSVILEPLGGGQSIASATLKGAPAGARWRALYVPLTAWTGEVPDTLLRRVDSATDRATLPLPLAPRDRLLVAIEVDAPGLACPFRIWSERLEAAP